MSWNPIWGAGTLPGGQVIPLYQGWGGRVLPTHILALEEVGSQGSESGTQHDQCEPDQQEMKLGVQLVRSLVRNRDEKIPLIGTIARGCDVRTITLAQLVAMQAFRRPHSCHRPARCKE